MQHETILNVFPADDDRSRLVVVMEQLSGKRNRLVLRQETFSGDVGWFVQSCIAIEPEQLQCLKMALTSNATRALFAPTIEAHRVPATLRYSDAVAGRVG